MTPSGETVWLTWVGLRVYLGQHYQTSERVITNLWLTLIGEVIPQLQQNGYQINLRSSRTGQPWDVQDLDIVREGPAIEMLSLHAALPRVIIRDIYRYTEHSHALLEAWVACEAAQAGVQLPS